MCYKKCPRNEYRYKIKGVDGDAFVSICFGDLLSDRGTILIPVNSSFDTFMDANMISSECIQGQFQNKYFFNNLHSLDVLIESALEKNTDFKTIKRDFPMKNRRYPLGTIAKMNISQDENKKRVYLLAVTDMNEFFIPENTSLTVYKDMVKCFWKQMCERGHHEDRLAVSVLGVGKAGYQIDLENALAYMVRSYIMAIKSNIKVKNLAIYINVKSIAKRELDVIKIKKHIEAICEYENTGL